MSIRIISQDRPGSSEKRTADMIPPLLFPRFKDLYNRHAERLRELAENSPLGDYLRSAALTAHAQKMVLCDHPLEVDLTTRAKEASARGKPPLNIHVLLRDKHQQKLLMTLITELKPEISSPVLTVIKNLKKAPTQELENITSTLFTPDFSPVSNDKAPLIWAALSLYWAQMTSLILSKACAKYSEQRQYCPVCGFMPVSSMVQIDTIQSLCYLHCNLCETEWHVVRIKCSNCEQNGKLHYWSPDDKQATIKVGSCDDRGTYLKIPYQGKEPKVEAVTDNLASPVLGARVEREGYVRSSINPFLFPGEREQSLTPSEWRQSPELQLIGCDDICYSREISRVSRGTFQI